MNSSQMIEELDNRIFFGHDLRSPQVFLNWIQINSSGTIVLKLRGPHRTVIQSQIEGCEQVFFSLSAKSIALIRKIKPDCANISDEEIISGIIDQGNLRADCDYFELNYPNLTFNHNHRILSYDDREHIVCYRENDIKQLNMQSANKKKAIVMFDLPNFLYEQNVLNKLIKQHQYKIIFSIWYNKVLTSLPASVKLINYNLVSVRSEPNLQEQRLLNELNTSLTFFGRSTGSDTGEKKEKPKKTQKKRKIEAITPKPKPQAPTESQDDQAFIRPFKPFDPFFTPHSARLPESCSFSKESVVKRYKAQGSPKLGYL